MGELIDCLEAISDRQIDMPLHEAYEYTSEVMVSNAGLEDAQEGMRAFLEKRQPHWRGK